MTEERVNRRLAAILAADVVGYSRLMGADEAGTLAALKRHRETVFDPAVAAHNGRIVKLIGDGVIAEFGSVVDAVNCALSVQRSSAATSVPSASQPAIVLRIGINLGDVIIEGVHVRLPNRWSNDPDGSLQLAKHYAEQAIEKNPKEPAARVVSAMVASRYGDFDRAASEVQTALSLNPNYAMAYNVIGAIHSYSGQPLEAIPMIERAMRLDPAHSEQYLHFLGMAYLLAGKYETAASHFRERIRLVPRTDFSRAPLASALGHLGEIDEARRIWRRTHGDQSEILIQRAFRPATVQATRRCPEGRLRSCEGRIAELSLPPERAISAPAPVTEFAGQQRRSRRSF